jgi:adenylyl- and sulfurtransferase ThiI
LKGKNRKKFERILINNIKKKIGGDLLEIKKLWRSFSFRNKK